MRNKLKKVISKTRWYEDESNKKMALTSLEHSFNDAVNTVWMREGKHEGIKNETFQQTDETFCTRVNKTNKY